MPQQTPAHSCRQPGRFLSWLRHPARAAAVLRLALQRGGGVAGVVRKACRLYRREGLAGVRLGFGKVASAAQFGRNDYAEWVRRYGSLDEATRAQLCTDMQGFALRPLISVVLPVFDPPLAFLEQAIESVRMQIYPHWELCIADDASTNPGVRDLLERYRSLDSRIRIVYRQQNGHIAASTNSALALAGGEFVALFDHDDLLAEHALWWIAEAINRQPDVGLVYSDEDKVDAANRRFDPNFKPDLNPELLLAQNMVCHLGVYRTALVRELGGFREGFNGAQDHDLALRVIEQLRPEQVVHVPKVLYHWRAISGSTALDAGEKNYAAEAGRRAVREHLARKGIAADVLEAPEVPSMNRVRFARPSPLPLVSILIPTRDRADLLGMCLDSLFARSSYGNFEVIIIDNGSTEEATRQLFARLPAERVQVIRDESPFNFAALNNRAAKMARGSLLCLMNNDIEILTPDWLEEMVSFAIRDEIGCVGARLWYPDGRLQHAGCILGVGGVASHAHRYVQRGQAGYFGRALLHQSFSAVTAACLVVRREVFELVGGMEEQLGVAFNDVDFCLKVRAAGYRNVWTPYAEMVHHESATRGDDHAPDKLARFSAEIAFVQQRWGKQLQSDPAYSPNLTAYDEDFSYAWPPR